MLGIIINNIGIYGAMTYYNIKLGSVTGKKEIQQNINGMILFFITVILCLEYIMPISKGMCSILSILFYLLIMKVMVKRNVFFLLFEYIFMIFNTVLAQIALFLFYCTPNHITVEQFEQSIFPQVVLSVFSVLTYIIVSKLIGKKLFEFRDTIWNKYNKGINYFTFCLGLLLIWLMLVDVVIFILKKGPMKDSLIIPWVVITISFVIISIGAFLVTKTVLQKKEILDLEDFANKDEMTGVLNRRAGLLHLQSELKSQRKANTRLIVGYVDINHLKHVNDTKGHTVGDQLICHVANHLRQHIDPVHRMIRMGGDEFLIVYKEMALEDVKELMTSLLAHVNDEKPEALQDVEISFSFGFSEYDREQLSHEELIRKADEEMYQHKMLYKQNLG